MQKIITVSLCDGIDLKFRYSSKEGGVRIGVSSSSAIDSGNPLRTTPAPKPKKISQEQEKKR